ncbi:hypothetical protein ACIQF6_34465 [Kitasatospora sp. NPDC092948]|uniref:hypothetical protein n=1 Tax=Kitasatospora sp. NPDC092948 TaxID=3364088 RepID=UPI00381F894B
MLDAVLGYTSGTTGEPTAFLSTPKEHAELDRLQASRASEGLTLSFTSTNHGSAAFGGFTNGVVPQPLVTAAQYEHVALMLERRTEPYSSLSRVTGLEGTLFRVKELTLYLMERRGRLDDLGIKVITVGRNLLSPGWRDRLERWWGAEIRCVYGFSELRVCNAVTCPTCTYHHMPPTGLAEVLPMDDDRSPVQPGGRGRLAVTAFHPYVQLEPRLRYYPGDLALLAPEPCPKWGEHGFRPLGREQHSVVAAGGELVCPADVYSAVADHPDVHRFHPTPPPQPMKIFSQDEVGSPRVRLERTDDGVELHVELRQDPLVWPEKAARAQRQIADGLRLPGAVNVVVHGPGRLGKVRNI